ncbi:DUF1844 domain-containing protein [Desulfobacca acetoxidans]|uniref:DUF1844 domain-containing protein n=1 Tax=Desulfobacca acetoxidans (strain ATCC 700848 / DSM 11109 / ASRB2) TaxID=880072 RepID=F2NCK2_DESAR|nr:DUF1844 domain-containing protein [Desulfobacca acetoxidans]AEB09136.1 Domain of unknown function DUF1844 [Desulfobacca acetoxidans DSM 11109]HAY22303.1 DUF1844 domain-containing protein [Desulfobacterales bacterium]
MTDTEEKGFTVKDRRFFQQSEEEKERLREESRQREEARATYEAEAAKPADAAKSQTGTPLPEINFASFIMSLGTSVFIHLGDAPHPETGKSDKDMSLAKQTIDLLGLLREKTRNNLTSEEENLFDNLLYDLRMRYVREVTKSGGA